MPTLDETLSQFSPDADVPTPQSTLARALEALRASGAGQSPANDVGLGLAGAHGGTDLQPRDTTYDTLANPPQPTLRPGFQADATPDPFAGQAGANRTGPDVRVPVDRIGVEHDTVSSPSADLSSDTAGYTPPAPEQPDPYALGPAAKTVDQATAQEDTALGRVGAAYQKAQDAKMAALTARDTALADNADRQAQMELEAQAKHEKARAAAEAQADLDNAKWMDDLQAKAKEEPLPGRWWHDQGHLGQALWALGLVFSSAHAAITPGAKNAALDMVRQNIQNDMDEQRARIGREEAVLKLKGSMLEKNQARTMADLNDDHSARMTRIMSLKRAWDARASVPGDLDAQAAKAESELFFAQNLMLPTVHQRRGELVQAREAQLNRNFQAGQQARAQAFQDKQRQAQEAFQKQMEDIQFEHKKALAPVSISGGYSLGPTGRPVDKEGRPLYQTIQRGTGLVLTDGKGNLVASPVPGSQPGDLSFRADKEDQFKAANAAVDDANLRFRNLTRLRDLMQDQSFVTGIASGSTDPEFESLLAALGPENAKKHDTRVTDLDAAKGLQEAIGFNPDGKIADRVKFFSQRDKIVALVQSQLDRMPKEVTAKLREFNDAEVNGQNTELVWEPPDMSAPKVKQKTSIDFLPKDFQPPTADTPVKGEDDYLKRKNTETEDPGQRGYLLKPHDDSAVSEVINGAENRSPSTVYAKAAEVLDRLNEKRKGLVEKTDPQYMAKQADGSYHSLSPEDRQKAQDALERVDNTIDYVDRVSQDEIRRQAKQVDAFKKRAEYLRSLYDVSEESLRTMAKQDFHLNDAEDEVGPIVQGAMKIKPLDIHPMGYPGGPK